MKKELYSVKYDISAQGDLCDGRVVVTAEQQDRDAEISVCVGDEVLITRPLADIDTLIVSSHVGCASLEAKLKDCDRVYLCRFTMSCMRNMSEFIQAVNFFIETGTYTPMHTFDNECPVCGSRFIPNTNICTKCSKRTSIFKRTMQIGGKYIQYFVLGSLLVLVSNVIMLAVPYLNRQLVDGYLYPASQGLREWSNDPIKAVVWLILGMFVCHVLSRIFSVFAQRLVNRGSTSFSDALRRTLFIKIQKLSLSSVSRRTPGDLIKRVTDDTNRISDFMQEQVTWIIEVGVIFLGVSVYMFVTRPVLALFVFIPVPIVLVLLSKFWEYIHMKYVRQWVASSTASGILHDIIKGIRVVKSFGTEKLEIKKYGDAARRLAEVSTEAERSFALLFPPLRFLITVGEFFVLFFGAQAVLGDSVIGGAMTLGELTQLSTYTAYIYGPLRWIADIPKSIANASTSMAKLNEILDEKIEIDDAPDAVQMQIHGNIKFENVTFGYKSYEPVLKNVNLEIKQGEMVGIVGHSGVGKSTLINLVMRLYDVNAGSLKIDGVDIRRIPKQTLCDSIGVVFQETFLFAGTVYDNILYAKPTATPEEVFAAAKIANAHEFIIKLPDAYNTVIGESGYSLSGGERQRLAIARAVLRDPAILILDEATASLDAGTEDKIQQALEKLIKGRTTIAIAHRLSTLRHADRLIVLEKGKVEETGTHDELMKNKGIYYNLVLAQRQTTKMAGK